MRLPRYRLRTLLLATIVVGGLLGWWFRPMTIEQHWPGGQRMSQFHVRRTWNGRLLTNGRQWWWWSDGTLARQGSSHGWPLGDAGGRSARAGAFPCPEMPLNDEQTFDRQGQPMSSANWQVLAAWERQKHRPPSRPRVVVSKPSFPETQHDNGQRIFVIP